MHFNCRKILFICLHLTFGATPAPEEYNTISEAEICLGNDTLADTEWDMMTYSRTIDTYSPGKTICLLLIH